MKIDRTEPIILAYDADHYSAFPDLVVFRQRYFCVYRESDSHHPTTSKLVMLYSRDGEEWSRDDLFIASFASGGYVFNCPRLNVLNNELVLICDVKTSQDEKESTWEMLMWKSSDGVEWSSPRRMNISGMVPDKLISCNNRLLMGYHIVEPKTHRLVQMLAASTDDGQTWRDRTTVAVSDKNDFCEGSIVPIEKKKLICYLRDNRGPVLCSQFVVSIDGGLSWTLPSRLDLIGHRIVAKVKEKEPYKGLVVGTFRNTVNKNITLFLHNLARKRTQLFHLDYESRDSMYDFGYTSWVEDDDGNLQVVYYIQRHRANPMICATKVTFQ